MSAMRITNEVAMKDYRDGKVVTPEARAATERMEQMRNGRPVKDLSAGGWRMLVPELHASLFGLGVAIGDGRDTERQTVSREDLAKFKETATGMINRIFEAFERDVTR